MAQLNPFSLEARPTRVRWLVFGLICATSWLLYLHRYAWGVVKPDFKAENPHLTDTQLGWIDSAVLATYALGQVPGGLASDLVGPRLVLGLSILLWSLTVAELAHGIYRADTPERARMRRQFLDELKAHVPVHAVTELTAEIIGRVGAEQAAKGITLPLADLIIGACALELGYAIGTVNVRDFNRIPGLNIIRL